MHRASRVLVPIVPLAFAAAPVFAQLDDGPTAPSPQSSASTSASQEPAPAATPYAPIVLSPGVPTTPPPQPTVAAAPKPVEPPPSRVWYGWQIVAADLAIAGTTFLLARSNEGARVPIAIGGTVLFVAAAPLLHVANGNSSAAYRSGLVHGISVFAGAVFGAIILEGFAGCTDRNPCRLSSWEYAGIGAAVAGVIAPIIDATWLAWKPARRDVSIAPTVRVDAQRATFGLQVVF